MHLRPFSERLREMLQEQPARLPVRYRKPVRVRVAVRRRPLHLETLIESFLMIARRGGGPEAWAAPLVDDPVAFVLEAIDSPVLLRAPSGEVVYRNRAALGLSLPAAPASAPAVVDTVECGGRRYRRRALRFGHGAATLCVEVLNRIGEG